MKTTSLVETDAKQSPNVGRTARTTRPAWHDDADGGHDPIIRVVGVLTRWPTDRSPDGNDVRDMEVWRSFAPDVDV